MIISYKCKKETHHIKWFTREQVEELNWQSVQAHATRGSNQPYKQLQFFEQVQVSRNPTLTRSAQDFMKAKTPETTKLGRNCWISLATTKPMTSPHLANPSNVNYLMPATSFHALPQRIFLFLSPISSIFQQFPRTNKIIFY